MEIASSTLGSLRGKGLRRRFPFLGRIFDYALPELSRPLVFKHVHGLKMFLDRTNEEVSAVSLGSGHYEPEETEFLQSVLRPGDTFIDVGANVGYFTLLGARAVGTEGQVLGFEPDRWNHWLLKENVSINSFSNVRLFRAALCSSPEVSRIPAESVCAASV